MCHIRAEKGRILKNQIEFRIPLKLLILKGIMWGGLIVNF
jgi:hypothetical protein